MTEIIDWGAVIYVEKPCPLCGTRSIAVVDTKGFEAWRNGMLIQRAFPNMNAKAREFLISGLCRDCQDKMFEEIEAIES